MLQKVFWFFIALLFSLTGYGQATIQGVVTDQTTKEPIPFVVVKVVGQNTGANTDFDGKYSISLKPGIYELLFSMSTDHYLEQHEEFQLEAGDEIIYNVALSKGQEFKEVTVTAAKVGGPVSVKADDERRQNEKGATDGVTAEQMKEKGVNTAVEAVSSAPGISVEDGKTVYIRGLGDRYTKTILNGMEIPGLDPDRNSVQMDIFPAAVIDNITVYKTFIPNFTGDYTGGLVNITTKDLPTERTIYTKFSLGYNSKATFNDDFLSYQGGKLDFLGFDDGTRTLPVRSTDKFSNPVLHDPRLETSTKQFSKTMATEKASNFLNQNYAFAYGNRVNFKKKDATGKISRSPRNGAYGYNIVLNYMNNNTYYDDIQFSEYRKASEGGVPVNNLEKFRASTGVLAENNVIWTALFGQSIQKNKTKIALTLFHTQNGKSSAAELTERNYEQNPSILQKQSLQYTQRSVSNANLSGIHYLDSLKKWKLEWKVSPTYSIIRDPDIRSTVLEEVTDANGNVTYDFTPAVGSEIRRIWRYLNEYNVGARMDLTRKFNYSNLKIREENKKLKAWASRNREFSIGALNTYKHRSFEVLDYLFDVANASEFSSDPNWYFQDENIWTAESDTGTFVKGNKEPANTYIASQNIIGGYIMNETPFTENFRGTYGVRVENAKNWYTGQNNTGTIIYDDTLVLDNWNVLPSVNLVYKIDKKADSAHYERHTNFRGAYAITVARPSFKEKSIAQIYDPIQGRTFNGNINLLQTTIHNADLRWEYFFGRTELISASAFYKRFINPIELVAFNSAPNETQPLNTGTADVYGAEIEIRKAIGFGKKNKEHLSFVVGANYTFVVSKINMNEVKITTGTITKTEKEIREANAREGEEIGNYRSMYGQSPHIINAFMTFKNDSLGLILNMSYNVQGKKLAVIGIGSLPDVYEQPFHSLNLRASKTIGREKLWSVSLTAKNILMSARKKYYESYQADSQIYDYYNQGMTISGSISYSLQGKPKNKRK